MGNNEEHIEDLVALNQIIEGLNRSADTQEAIALALERLLKVMDLQTGWIFLRNPDTDGRFRGNQGDSYVMLIRWDSQGRVESYSIHQYGSATLDEKSVHFADQSPLFARQDLKPVWLDESDIRAHLEQEYKPGEEIGK